MASILLKVIFITACLCWSTCLSQNQEQLLLIFVREAAEGIKTVSKKITDLDDKFTTKFGELDDKFTAKFGELDDKFMTKFGEVQGELQLLQHLDDKFTTKFGELDDKFTAKFGEVQGELQLLQRQMVELQESSKSDNLLNMFVEILKLERDLQKDIWNNQTCTVQHLTELQANFSTEFQNLEASMEDSSVDQLSNLTMLLAKEFQNLEASMEDSSVDQLSNLTMLLAKVSCHSPSHFMPSLGCITLVREDMTWEDARQNCIKQGGRLLQRITNYDELQQLDERFGIELSSRGSYKYHAWIGIKGGNWIEGGDPSINDPAPSSSLWGSGQPDYGNAGCGFAYLDSSPVLHDAGCHHPFYSLCQRK